MTVQYTSMKHSNFMHNNLDERGRFTTIVLVLLLLIVVAAGATAATYFWQNSRVKDLNDKISSFQSQLSDQQNQQRSAGSSVDSTKLLAESYTSQKGVKIIVYTPAKDAKLTSPVGVVGKVPGNWSSEASFPIQIKDSSGKVVAQGTGQLLGDWMTDQLVPFSAKLTYSSAAPGNGTLVLQKDNPSGQASKDDFVSIPVQL